MNRRVIFVAVFLIILFILIFRIEYHVVAQTSVPQKILITSIQERARHDVALDKAPESIQDLQLMFGTDAISQGLNMRDVVTIYEDAYTTAKTNEPWWKVFRPNLGWIVAIIVFILLVIRDTLQEIIISLIRSVKDNIYNSFAGSQLLRRIALVRYRKALVEKYHQIKMPFRPDRPLEMADVFVPLKITGSKDNAEIDAYYCISHQKRLMLTGAPGSGKSTLLRHLVLTYAKFGLSNISGQPIPILLELNRLNESNTSLEDHLTIVFRLNDFPHAEKFVNYGLEHGTFLVLFDGLDEVNSSKREQVVQQIKDFINKYARCRVLVTCRTAVYHQEFAEVVDQSLELMEFSDQQIRRFLAAWQKDMPPGKTIDELIHTLRDRPRIMALARNPLLLTIIAYLYTDVEFVLPHSRTEFYDQATNVLLRQWKVEQNRYNAPNKRLVLEHLALFIQDNSVQHQQDRRSIDRVTTLQEVNRVLPGLNLESKDAIPLLDEVVERSGLLLAIDGGERYQFAHLTLQEYFAANALKNDSDHLIERFKQDQELWREVVKLWCGFEHDSTAVVRAIYTDSPITALECLADTQKIDPALADEIIEVFKPRLGENSDVAEAITRAFATVAADVRPRGKLVANFLEAILNSAENKKRTEAAATALSLTNLSRSAHVLINYFDNRPEVRPALVRMGDLSVSALFSLVRAQSETVLDALEKIGTPHAAEVLVPLLWDSDFNLSCQVAWRLAAILPKTGVVLTIREFPLTSIQRHAQQLDWIWDAFEEPPNSSVPIIAGRIAYLLEHTSPDLIPSRRLSLDPRLALPLCAIGRNKEISQLKAVVDKDTRLNIFVVDPKFLTNMDSYIIENPIYSLSDLVDNPLIGREQLKSQIQKKLTEMGLTLTDIGTSFSKGESKKYAMVIVAGKKNRHVNIHYANIEQPSHGLAAFFASASPQWLYILNCLPQYLSTELLSRFITGTEPTINDWRNISKSTQYIFETGWHFKLIRLITGVTSLIALIEVAYLFWFMSFSQIWINSLFILGTIILICGWSCLFALNDFNSSIYKVFKLTSNLPQNRFYLGYASLHLISTKTWKVLIILVLWFLITSYLFTRFLLELLAWPFALLAYIALVTSLVMLWIIGRRTHRSANNPLQGLLDSENTHLSNRQFRYLYDLHNTKNQTTSDLLGVLMIDKTLKIDQ